MVRQLNQVAAFFEAYPEDRAENSVLEHIQKFMAPPLRQQLADYVAAGGNGLRPLAAGAVKRLPEAQNNQ